MQHYPAGEAKIGVAAEVFPLYYCKQNGVENGVLAEHWDDSRRSLEDGVKERATDVRQRFSQLKLRSEENSK
jgi:hypothetical protein